MSLNQNLRLAQVQKLVMTQQMQQAVKLLQLNHQELVAEVQQQLVENPTLEEVPGSITRDFNEAEHRLQDASRAQVQDVVDQNNGTGAGGDNIDWNKYTERFQTPPGDRVAGSSGMDELPPIETNLTRSAELADHLLGQLRTLLTRLEDGQAAAAQARRLVAALDAIESVLVDPKRESVRDVLRHQAGLDDQLADMVSVVSIADEAPTTPALEVSREAMAQVDEQLAQLQACCGPELAALNAALRAADVEVVAAGA